MTTIFLKYAGACTNCGMHLKRGRRAHYNLKNGIRCTLCGPHPLNTTGFKTTTFPPGTAQGAVDSSRKPMMTAEMAKALAMGTTGGPKHGKRRRLPSKIRRAAQHRNNS